jgi:aryl-alcohol dehydrogenase-like predicted oxidoreductase
MEQETRQPPRPLPIWSNGTEIGIGTWSWGDKLFWNFGHGYDKDDVEAAFEASLADGIHFFDTAELYGWGRSEELLGQFIRQSGQPTLVTTKFFPYPWRLTRGSLLRALRTSLGRLGMKQVDLYLIHSPWSLVPVETWMDALADAVETGLTRYVGVSNYDVEKMQRAHAALARRGVSLVANEVEYSLLQRNPEHSGLLDTARKLGVKVISYSPLAQGVLTGKYTPENPMPGVRGRRYNKRLANVQPLIELEREIGQAHGGKTPAQVAINWVMCKGAVPIPGAKNARQADENAGATGWHLAEDEVTALGQASEGLVNPLLAR